MKKLIEDIKKLTNFFQFLQDYDPKDYNSEDLQCKADEIRDELREDGIDTCTEYNTIRDSDNKGSAIL